MSRKSVFNPELYAFLQKDKQTKFVWRDRVEHEDRDKYGKTNLAESNLTPKELAINSTKLPHSQISDQNFLAINPKLVRPREETRVNMTPYKRTVLSVPVLRKAIFDDADMYLLSMAFVTPFYLQRFFNKEMSQHLVYRAYLTALASWDQSLTDIVANKGAESGDIEFKFEYYDRRTNYINEYSKVFPDFLDVNLKIKQSNATQDVLFCLACVIMQTLGKQVNEDNVTGWFKNRLRAIAARIGNVNIESWDEFRPSTISLQTANRSMAQLFEFRRMIVDRMFHYQKEKTKMGEMFSMVLGMIACTDITHVVNIDVYLVKTMPELLNLQMLRPYDDQLVAMYEFWKKYKDIFPYVRFYVRPEECHPINRHCLMPLIIASHVVATYTSNTFKNYKGAQVDSDLFKSINAIVNRYIQMRNTSASIALGVSERTIMTELEKLHHLENMDMPGASVSDSALIRDLEKLNLIHQE